MSRTLLSSLLLGAMLAGSAAPVDAQRRRDRDEDEVVRLDTTLAFSRDGFVELESMSGDITVTGWDRNEVRIRASSERGDLRLDATPSRIQVKSVAMGWADVTYDVSVPVGTHLLLTGRSTTVDVRGTRGSVEVHTQNGDITVSDAGAVEVDALNGDVDLRTVERVQVNLTAGDVRIDRVAGPAAVTTVSGDIEVINARSSHVQAQTTSGEVTYDGSIESSGRYEFTSHSGNVVVRIPADASAAVSLQTYSGAIESDFPITLTGGATMGGHPRTFDFRLGNGGARITMVSFSGEVHLQRAGTTNRQED